jgi:hypothetical protein
MVPAPDYVPGLPEVGRPPAGRRYVALISNRLSVQPFNVNGTAQFIPLPVWVRRYNHEIDQITGPREASCPIEAPRSSRHPVSTVVHERVLHYIEADLA